jgi:sugar lactone lactonase YvrE
VIGQRAPDEVVVGDRKTGKLLALFGVDATAIPRVAVARDVIFWTAWSSRRVHAFSLEGKKLWSVELPVDGIDALALGHERVYVLGQRAHQGLLFCLGKR